MSVIGTIANRVYADFLMPSRLGHYRTFLESVLGAGYAVDSLGGFHARSANDAAAPGGRRLILRHDVDTDRGTARAMFEIERSLGIAGSWFFRLATLDLALMTSIAGSGAEASYHYEELATVAKARRLRTRAAAVAAIPEALDQFASNIERLRAATGLPMHVVASHGDFVNRRLGIANWEILADRATRAAVGVDLEAYDPALMDRVTARHSDTLHPVYWTPEDPAGSIGQGEPVVHVLVHPRHWRTARRVNAVDDLRRVAEAVRFGLPLDPRRNAT